MSEQRASRPKRFYRWLFGSPFRQLPPAFGNPVPPDLAAVRSGGRGCAAPGHRRGGAAGAGSPREEQPGARG